MNERFTLFNFFKRQFLKQIDIFNIISKKNDSIDGYAFAPNSSEPNKLKVVFPMNILNISKFETTGDYNIWNVNYSSYSLVYSRSTLLFLKTEYAWILSRKPTLANETIALLKKQLSAKGVDVTKFKKTVQNCY